MNLAMEDKIKEGFYALCLAILKGYSVSEAFHALEMSNWKKDPSKIDIWATAQERSVTETAKECGCCLNRKALQADEIGTAEFVGCFWK